MTSIKFRFAALAKKYRSRCWITVDAGYVTTNCSEAHSRDRSKKAPKELDEKMKTLVEKRK